MSYDTFFLKNYSVGNFCHVLGCCHEIGSHQQYYGFPENTTPIQYTSLSKSKKCVWRQRITKLVNIGNTLLAYLLPENAIKNQYNSLSKLKNTQKTVADIWNVKHLRSWLSFYQQLKQTLERSIWIHVQGHSIVCKCIHFRSFTLIELSLTPVMERKRMMHKINTMVI